MRGERAKSFLTRLGWRWCNAAKSGARFRRSYFNAAQPSPARHDSRVAESGRLSPCPSAAPGPGASKLLLYAARSRETEPWPRFWRQQLAKSGQRGKSRWLLHERHRGGALFFLFPLCLNFGARAHLGVVDTIMAQLYVQSNSMALLRGRKTFASRATSSCRREQSPGV